jgi:tRNA A-37 threonylcarbamoyl transferase component Bud32
MAEFDGIKVLSDTGLRGKDGKILKVIRGKKHMIAKVFKKNKNKGEIENEFCFLKKGYELGISPRVFGYNVGENNYILMDELSDTVFEEIKKSGGKLSLKSQTRIIKILEILDDEGVFHGDTSPLNFMRDSQGEIYIIDYGMAKIIDEKFIKKHGENSNVKLGLSVLVLKTREIYPGFEPKLILKNIMKNLDLPSKRKR